MNEKKPAHFLQLGLLSMLLLVACFGSWLAYYQGRMANQHYIENLPILRDAANVLRVEDPDQYAIVQQDDSDYQEKFWKVYLPPGNRYGIYLECSDHKEAALDKQFFEITPGEHNVRIKSIGKINDLKLPFPERTVEETILISIDGDLVLEKTRSFKKSIPMLSKIIDDSLHQVDTSLPLIFNETTTPKSGNLTQLKPELTHTSIWIEKLSD